MSKRAQSTLEYAVIIAVVVAALLAMQFYMKRSIQGRLRSSVDDVGGQFSAGNTVYNRITQQIGDQNTSERFGTDDLGRGVSRTEIIAPARINQTYIENTTTQLSEESLF